MRALTRLLLLPLTRTWLISTCGLLSFGLAMFEIWAMGSRLEIVAFLPPFLLGLYFCGLASGQALAPLLVNESLLLPYFRRRLLQAGLILGLALFGITALVLAASDQTQSIALAVSLGVVAWTSAIAASIERIYSLVPLLLVFVPQLMPERLAVIGGYLQSVWSVPLGLLIGAFMLWHVLHDRLRASDPSNADSPMAFIGSRWARNPAESGQRPGRFVGLLRAVFEGGADYTLQRAIAAQSQRDTRLHRARLFRAVLLPYDSAIGVVLNTGLVMISYAAVLWVIAYNAGPGGASAHTMAYLALIMGRTRCAAMGASFARMQPHLADLYLAVAPRRNADFQRRIFDTLATVIPVVIVQTLIGGGLIYALLGDARPVAMLGAMAIAAAGMAAVDMSIELLGPRQQAVRYMIGIGTTLLYIAAYGLVYLACVWVGTPMGLLLTGVPILVVGAGVFWLARDSFIDQPPAFGS